jgi:hypothetical protein
MPDQQQQYVKISYNYCGTQVFGCVPKNVDPKELRVVLFSEEELEGMSAGFEEWVKAQPEWKEGQDSSIVFWDSPELAREKGDSFPPQGNRGFFPLHTYNPTDGEGILYQSSDLGSILYAYQFSEDEYKDLKEAIEKGIPAEKRPDRTREPMEFEAGAKQQHTSAMPTYGHTAEKAIEVGA